jgi:hypothetical protein
MKVYYLLFPLFFISMLMVSSCGRGKIKNETENKKPNVDSINGFVSINFGDNRSEAISVMSSRPGVKRIKRSYSQDEYDYSSSSNISPLMQDTKYLRYEDGKFAGLKVSEWILTFLKEEFSSGWVGLEVPVQISHQKFIARVQKNISNKYGSFRIESTQFGEKIVWRLEGGKLEFWRSGASAPAISYRSYAQDQYLDSLKKKSSDKLDKGLDSNSSDL